MLIGRWLGLSCRVVYVGPVLYRLGVRGVQRVEALWGCRGRKAESGRWEGGDGYNTICLGRNLQWL